MADTVRIVRGVLALKCSKPQSFSLEDVLGLDRNHDCGVGVRVCTYIRSYETEHFWILSTTKNPFGKDKLTCYSLSLHKAP